MGRHGASDGPTAAGMNRLSRALGPAMVALASAAMMAWGWLRWADDHIDFGRELYLAWRLSEGDVLYRDVAHVSGPLSPYVNALPFRLLSPGMHWIFAANTLVAALILRLLYRLLTRLAGRGPATTAALFFVAVFGFGELVGSGNYNYVAPYSHEMTHGFLLALLCLDRVRALHRRGRLRDAGLGGLVLGLAFLTKAEIFLAAAVAAATYLALVRREIPRSRPPVAVAVFGTALLVPPLLSLGLLSLAMPVPDALRGTLGSWPGSLNREVSALYYYRRGMGLDDPVATVLAMGLMMAVHAAVAVPAAGIALLPGPRLRRALALAVGPAMAAALYLLPGNDAWYELARPLPVYAAAILAAEVAAWRRARPGARRREALGVAASAMALLLLAKTGLNARFYHYGFVLSVPAALLVVVALVGWLPRALSRRGRGGRELTVLATCTLAAVAAAHLRIADAKLGRKNYTIGHGRDAMRSGSRGPDIREALDEIEASTHPSDTVLVIPDGVMLNYLARRRSPTRYINFMPPELLILGEDAMVEALRRTPPRRVVVVHNDTYFPYRMTFPRDFGQKLWAFVTERYRQEVQVGGAPMDGTRFGILIMEPREP